MVSKVLFSLVFIVLMSASGDAQTRDSVWFAGKYISLGMPKHGLFDYLVANYDLSKVNSRDQWGVSTNRPESTLLGIIAFNHDRVDFVSKSWNPPEHFAIEGFQALYRAMKDLSEGGFHNARISVDESNSPDGTLKTITLRSGNRRFVISIIDLAGRPKEATLSEIIQR